MHPVDVAQGYCGHCHDWTGDALAGVDPLDESSGYTNAGRMDAAVTERGVALILKSLTEREAVWRDRVGDEDYDQAVAHWREVQRNVHGEEEP